MLKILVVEDQVEKKQALCEAIGEVDPRLLLDIDCVTDVLEAKKALKRAKYQLLVLDLNIPGRMDDGVRVGGGLEILHFICDNDAAIPPTNIIGITAYDDIAAVAKNESLSLIWKILLFSFVDRSWRAQLQSVVRFAIRNAKPPFPCDGNTFHTDLGIVVALEEDELEPILQLPGKWHELSVSHDSTRYWKGAFERGDRSLSVVVTAAPAMGMPVAAILASKLINTFRPRFLVMPGICAGVKDKVNIGDIVVADPCFDWGSGKWLAIEGSKEIRFKPAPYQWRLDPHLSTGVKAVAANEGLLRQIRNSFDGDRASDAPKVLVGPMASGGSVLQASMLMEEVREQHKNLIGVDMEAYGVFSAAEYASQPKPKCVVMKAVSDFGNDIKNDKYHKYAAYCSARFLYEFALSVLAT